MLYSLPDSEIGRARRFAQNAVILGVRGIVVAGLAGVLLLVRLIVPLRARLLLGRGEPVSPLETSVFSS